MTLPYSSSSSGDKALGEIQKVLQHFGCSKFELNQRRVSFPASFKGYAAAWLKEKPYNANYKYSLKDHEKRALEIGSTAVYSILRDWIKAQVTAIETGIVSFDEVFAAHILLPNGKRLIEHLNSTKLLE